MFYFNPGSQTVAQADLKLMAIPRLRIPSARMYARVTITGFLYVIGDRVSPCSSGWPETHYVD